MSDNQDIRLSTVPQFCKRHPAFPEGGMRHYLFNRATNGLASSGAILQIGRKLLIDETLFFRWIRQSGGGK